jgi:cAMP-dependent protein kinase regulator
VSNESLDSAQVQTLPTNTIKKTAEEKGRIRDALEHNALFSALDDDELEKLFDVMDSVTFGPSEVIIKQGDEGELFYIIDTGSVEVYKDDKLVTKISDGGSFGELALIYGTPRAATVKASNKEGCKCWTINRLTFRRVLMEATTQKRKRYENFLRKVRILETLDDYERMTIADALEIDLWQSGQTIVKQGESGDSFYILLEGSVDIYKTNERGERSLLGKLGEGDYFGEIALLLDQPRAATVVVSEGCDQVKTVRLDRRSFKNLLGNVEDLLKRNMELYNQFMLGI